MSADIRLCISAFLLLCFSVYLGGCVGLQPFPHVARAGDSIALALGPGENVTRANTTVMFTPDDPLSNSIDLTPHVSAIFKLLPDKTSHAALRSNATLIPINSGHEIWVTVMALNLPSGLPTGTGKIQVTTTGTYPNNSSHVNDVPIALEILPGTGTPHPFEYQGLFGSKNIGNLPDLEPLPQVTVRPPVDNAVLPSWGAVEVKLHIPMARTDGTPLLDNARIYVVVDDMSVITASQLQTSWMRTGNDVTVMLLSPLGMEDYEPRFSILLESSAQFTGTPQLTSVKYYDLNGNLSNGPELNVSLEHTGG